MIGREPRTIDAPYGICPRIFANELDVIRLTLRKPFQRVNRKNHEIREFYGVRRFISEEFDRSSSRVFACRV